MTVIKPDWNEKIKIAQIRAVMTDKELESATGYSNHIVKKVLRGDAESTLGQIAKIAGALGLNCAVDIFERRV